MNLYQTVSVKTSSYEHTKAEFLLGFKRVFRKELENTFKSVVGKFKDLYSSINKEKICYLKIGGNVFKLLPYSLQLEYNLKEKMFNQQSEEIDDLSIFGIPVAVIRNGIQPIFYYETLEVTSCLHIVNVFPEKNQWSVLIDKKFFRSALDLEEEDFVKILSESDFNNLFNEIKTSYSK